MLYNDITIGGELYHYGVKGMKWGIRRYQPYGSGYKGSTGKFIGKQGSGEHYNRRNNHRRNRYNNRYRSNERLERNDRIRNAAKKTVYDSMKNEAQRKKEKAIVGLAGVATIGALALGAMAIRSASFRSLAKKGIKASSDLTRKSYLKSGIASRKLKEIATTELIKAGISAAGSLGLYAGLSAYDKYKDKKDAMQRKKNNLNKQGSMFTSKKVDSNTDSAKLYKTLKKEIKNSKERKDKAKETGAIRSLMSMEPIGPNSKKLIDEYKKNVKKYEQSPEYKKWEQKVKKFEKDHPEYYDNYDKDWKKLYDSRPKRNFNDLTIAKTLKSNGDSKWTYANDYVNKGGKSLTIAYLKDLGYSPKEATAIADKLAKRGRTLGDI